MNNIEKVVLPSNGLLEDTPKEVEIRGMKGIEISTLFSSLTDAAVDKIIRSVVTPTLNTDTMCDEDKKFILYKTRELTFGNEITQELTCPNCGNKHKYEVKHSDLETVYLDEDILNEPVELPDGTKITKRVATKEVWDKISRYKEKRDLPKEYAFILLFVSKIDKVNGEKLALGELIAYLENLEGRALVKLTEGLDFNFGLDTTFDVRCKTCDTKFVGGIGINADLFR